ncbi:MAG: transglutaminase domain-containing protein [Clostridia bacterium]|nr:transglutaminase domain-containing protein [Clostridia bacterium]
MKTVNKKRIAIAVSIVSAVVLLLSVGVLTAIFISATTEKITVEVGEEPKPEKIHDSVFLSSLYQVEPYRIDVTKPGEHSIGLKFFGFLPGKVTVEVCDTAAPEIMLRNVHTVEGTALTAEDFVLSCSDVSEVAFTADISTEKAGEYTITVTAADAAGNTAEGSAILKVWEESHILLAELNAADLEKTIREKHPDVTEVDLGDISTATVGEYIIRASSDEAVYVWPVKVSDTTPPEVETRNRAVRPGETLVPEDFIVSINEVSEYTTAFSREIRFDTQGLKSICLVVEDVHGNRTEAMVRLLIADIPGEISVEYGISTSEVAAAILEKVYIKNRFSLTDCPTEIGSYEVIAETEYGNYTVQLEIADTTPPHLLLRETTLFTGNSVQPEAFVVSAEDASEVLYRFEGESPLTDTVGTYPITIEASDIHGNKSRAETLLHVINDTTSPVIYGIADKKILVGETVSFKKGVYAVDDNDGNVSFQVDSSAVNTAEEGTYPVTYTSTDAAGNQTQVTVYLTVMVNNMNAVNDLADQILAKITTASMTSREKAWAIYTWTTANLRYSTRTSYLMGNYVEGAYSGLSIRSGNCYIYYAVSGALLTRAGVENIMIQRDKPDDPHYWNLVKIDGDWYHFDTCPQYPGHEMQCFLKTDAELADYNKNEVADYYSFDSSLYPATP